jgi:hypothetical protein
MSYALQHSGEHVIKFAHTGDSGVLAAAQRVGDLIK